MMQLRGGVGGGENKDSVNGRLSAECDVALPRRSTTNGTQVPVYIRPPLSFPSTSTHVQ